jgi:predicted Zn finger-like uncharacterized protein
MNVACPACPAKYAVPDEKVRGKKARITCKRCGSAIIIDGTVLTQPSRPPAKPRPEPLPPPPEAPSETPPDEWLVAITDDRQEPASTDRIVALYASGTIDAETFLWKEGMAEWQTAFEIPEIASALEARGLSHRVIEPGVDSIPSSMPTYDDDEATHIGRPSAALAAQTQAATSGWTEPGRWGADAQSSESQAFDDDLTISRDSAPLGSPYPFQPDDSSDDARTIAREPSSPYGAPYPAGSAPDSSRSLPRTTRSSVPGAEVSPSSRRRHVRPAQRDSATPAAAAAGRRTAATASPASERGARGKVADLFGAQAGAGAEDDPSLGRADSSPPDAGARLTGQRNESSVLFSLDALIKAEGAPEEQQRAPRPDLKAQRETELLLGGAGPSSIAGLGGDFNALVAPDLLAPARAMPEPLASHASYEDFAPPASRASKWLKALLLVVLAGGIGAAIAVFAPRLLNPPKEPLVTANIPAEKAPPRAEPPTPTETEAAPTPSEAASAAPPPTGVAATPKADAPSTSPGPRAPSEPRGAPAKPPEAPEKEKSLAEAMGEGTTAPFDAGAAKAALTGAANGAAGCKKEGGPTGTGRALVTFAPSGRVTKAEVTGDFAGTSVGGCVARLFRAARVPKFSGDPTTVSKNFTIE